MRIGNQLLEPVTRGKKLFAAIRMDANDWEWMGIWREKADLNQLKATINNFKSP